MNALVADIPIAERATLISRKLAIRLLVAAAILIADRIDRSTAAKETVLKFAPLRMLVRYLPVILVVPIFVTTASIVHASMICMRIDEFSVVSDSTIQQQLQAHVKTLPGLKNYEIRPINSRFFVVSSENENAKRVPAATIGCWICGMGRSKTSLPFKDRVNPLRNHEVVASS